MLGAAQSVAMLLVVVLQHAVSDSLVLGNTGEVPARQASQLLKLICWNFTGVAAVTLSWHVHAVPHACSTACMQYHLPAPRRVAS